MAENNQPSIILCPYCGHIQQLDHKCEACGGYFDRLSLKATQVAMGPWFIHNPKKPFKPGCSYDVIKKQAAAGRIHNRTIMRGPTTRQFWSFAKNVPGVAHLIGYCHHCGTSVTPTDAKCHKCNAQFRDVALRNELGLLYPTPQDAAKAQEQLDKETNPATAGQHKEAKAAAGVAAAAQAVDNSNKPAGEDLLDEVIGRVEKQTGGKAVRATPASAKPQPPAQAGHAAKSAAASAQPEQPVRAVELGEIDDEEDEVTPSTGQNSRNTIIIVILVLGILGVLTIQVLMYGNSAGWFADTGNQSGLVTNDPTMLRSSSGTGTTSESPRATPESTTPTRFNDPTSTIDNGSSTSGSTTSSNQTVTPPKPVAPQTTATPPTGNTVPKPPAQDANPEQTLREQFQRALQLESQNKLKESLAILEDIKKRTPVSQIPKEMHDAIHRIQAKIAQQGAPKLFDIP